MNNLVQIEELQLEHSCDHETEGTPVLGFGLTKNQCLENGEVLVLRFKGRNFRVVRPWCNRVAWGSGESPVRDIVRSAAETLGRRVLHKKEMWDLVQRHFAGHRTGPNSWGPFHVELKLLKECQPVYSSFGTAYYELREIVKLLPPRTRCAVCRLPFSRWEERHTATDRIAGGWICLDTCSYRCWEKAMEFLKKEKTCLAKGKLTLKEVRRVLMEKRRAASPSRREESRPRETSPI